MSTPDHEVCGDDLGELPGVPPDTEISDAEVTAFLDVLGGES